jgi:hypothetical protein
MPPVPSNPGHCITSRFAATAGSGRSNAKRIGHEAHGKARSPSQSHSPICENLRNLRTTSSLLLINVEHTPRSSPFLWLPVNPIASNAFLFCSLCGLGRVRNVAGPVLLSADCADLRRFRAEAKPGPAQPHHRRPIRPAPFVPAGQPQAAHRLPLPLRDSLCLFVAIRIPLLPDCRPPSALFPRRSQSEES